MTKDFEHFQAVRAQQAHPHPCGQGSALAFSSGRCHVLALALSEVLPGDLVVLTDIERPEYLVHAALHHRGRVTDAMGHHRSGDWSKTWECHQQGTPLWARKSTREELALMMPECPITEAELTAARPLAKALANAKDVAFSAWRARLPTGAWDQALSKDPIDDHTAYTEALAKPPLPFVPPARFGRAAMIEGGKISPIGKAPNFARYQALMDAMATPGEPLEISDWEPVKPSPRAGRDFDLF